MGTTRKTYKFDAPTSFMASPLSSAGSEPFKGSLADRLCDAFEQVINDSAGQELLKQFRGGFEYRTQIRWLGEAREDGLAYALGEVLHLIGLAPRESLEQPPRVELDDGFVAASRRAFSKAIEDDFVLQSVSYDLRRAGLAPEALSVSELRRKLEFGLQQYYHFSTSGTSVEPW